MGEQSDGEMRPFAASLPMALLRAREVAMQYFRPLLAVHDLTEQQWRVLRALQGLDQPIDAGELAARTFLLAPSVSRIVANLDERGLLERSTDEADQRRSLLSLSELGDKTVAAIAPVSEERYRELEAAFGPQRLDRLQRELSEFARLADQHAADDATAEPGEMTVTPAGPVRERGPQRP
jgi:homoprotocatechuate degradation regulator HpaR